MPLFSQHYTVLAVFANAFRKFAFAKQKEEKKMNSEIAFAKRTHVHIRQHEYMARYGKR